MVRTVRVRYVPYAYGMKYAYSTQQCNADWNTLADWCMWALSGFPVFRVLATTEIVK